MSYIKQLCLSLLSLLLCVGCERDHIPFGGKSLPRSALQEQTAQASLSLAPNLSHVSAIAPKTAEAAIDPAALYTKACVACHQANGAGIPAAFPPLDGSPYVVSDNVERLAAIMLYGLIGPIKVNGLTYASAMAPLGGQYGDKELAAIATYIRSSWSNKAAAVTEETFASARKKHGARGPFAIQELGEEQ